MWALSDDMGTVELFANVADGLQLQNDLFRCGLDTTLRLLEITELTTSAIH